MDATQDAVLKVNRSQVLLRLILGLAIFGLGCLYLERHIPIRQSALLLAPVMLLIAARPVYLLVTGRAVECSTEGLLDHTAGLGFLPWSEVRAARSRPYMFGQVVELELYDTDRVLKRFSAPKAWLWRYNLKKAFRGLPIMAFYVAGGATAVLEAIRGAAPSKVAVEHAH